MEKTRILIVEDETIIALGIESTLKSLGYEVTSAVNTGEKAIQKAEEDKPDLILMDIRIKGEMDGIEAAEVIRNRFSIPIIFSTAYLDQERIERAKITMPFGYVLKPLQDRELRVTLEMALYVAKVDRERKKVEEELASTNENLRTHQFELETQNEELRITQVELAELHNRYFQFYEFAPVGYLIFSKKGTIAEINLTACSMLGIDKTMLKGLSPSNFIDYDSQDTFYHHRQLSIDTKAQQTCELTLVKKDKIKFLARLESNALFDDKGGFIQMNTNIIDLTKKGVVTES